MSSHPQSASALASAQQCIRSRCCHPLGSFIGFPPAEVEQSIPARFEQQVRQYPSYIAVKTRHHTLTYAELNQAANLVAHAILERCQSAAAPIALLFEHGAPFVSASLGVMKAGKIQVPLESTLPQARLSYMLEQSQAAVLVTNSANLALARELGAPAVLNIDELDGCSGSANPEQRVPPDAEVAIAYTSGSTGQPKGIVWNHRGLLHAVMRHTNVSRMCRHDRLVMFRIGLRGYLYALLNGAAFYPVDLRREEPLDIAHWLIQEEITVYRTAVSTFRSLANTLSGAEKFPHLRLILLLGEPVYHTDVALYRQHFAPGCLFASTLGCSEFDDYAYFFVDQDSPLASGIVPGGYPIDNTEILLLDDSGQPVGVDQIGEIAIRSRYNAVGYWRRADLTQAAFLPDPTGGDACLYRTGDLGRRGSDGCLWHLGRKDFQVKIRGHRVEVAEVETALLEVAGVQEAVVVGREDTPGDKRLVAYCILAGPHIPTVSELRRSIGNKLPDYMVPSTYIRLETLPRTATGKVDRGALPPPDHIRPVLDTPFVAPRTPVEERLVGIWTEVLGLDRVGVHDSFLDLGGDSLLATQVTSRVLVQLQVRLPLQALLAAPTVAEMAEVIVQSQASKLEASELNQILAELEAVSEDTQSFLTPPSA